MASTDTNASPPLISAPDYSIESAMERFRVSPYPDGCIGHSLQLPVRVEVASESIAEVIVVDSDEKEDVSQLRVDCNALLNSCLIAAAEALRDEIVDRCKHGRSSSCHSFSGTNMLHAGKVIGHVKTLMKNSDRLVFSVRPESYNIAIFTTFK